MKRKWLGALVALGMTGVAAPASAGETTVVPGCYGAVVTVCDVTVTTENIEVTQREYPVCAGTCTTVSAPGVGFGEGLWTYDCASYRDYYGSRTEYCAGVNYHDGKVCVGQEVVYGPDAAPLKQVCLP